MFHVYMLRCADGSYYVGHTDDLDCRIGEHQAGRIPGYTATRLPVERVWSDGCGTREEALSFERQLKGWSRTKKEALIRGDWPGIREAARKALRHASSGDQAATQGEPDIDDANAPPPVIVLVRPQLAENIGKAARAMLNFGLVEMRLVAPRDGWPNPAAGPASSGADRVLESAQVFDTLADAIADCAHIYATTVRKRGVTKPVVTPEEAARAIHADATAGPTGRSAILFGPERSGLETDDVAVARTIVTVPINPAFGSLNLAQAVILMAYEWSKHEGLAQPTLVEADPPAGQGDLDGLVGHLERLLDDAGFFFPPDRVPTTKRSLRSILTRPAWSAQEVRTLRGVLSALENPRPPRS